jgi:hypothetical protein
MASKQKTLVTGATGSAGGRLLRLPVQDGGSVRCLARQPEGWRPRLPEGVEVNSESSGSRLRQTARFDPVGRCGLAYGYGVRPLHQIVFAGMLRGMAGWAEKSA